MKRKDDCESDGDDEGCSKDSFVYGDLEDGLVEGSEEEDDEENSSVHSYDNLNNIGYIYRNDSDNENRQTSTRSSFKKQTMNPQ